MSYDTRTNRKTEMTVADFVISGELFEMAAGPVGFAAGAQWRDESYAVVRDPLYTQTNDPVTGALIPVDLIFVGGAPPAKPTPKSAIHADLSNSTVRTLYPQPIYDKTPIKGVNARRDGFAPSLALRAVPCRQSRRPNRLSMPICRTPPFELFTHSPYTTKPP